LLRPTPPKQGQAGVGIDQGDFEGVVWAVVDVVEGDTGEGKAENAVGFAKNINDIDPFSPNFTAMYKIFDIMS
jgi:hypothetical protein